MTMFIYVTMFIFGLSDRVAVYSIVLTFSCDNVYLCDTFFCGLSNHVAVYPIALTILFDNVYLLNNMLRSIGSCYGLPDHVDGFM